MSFLGIIDDDIAIQRVGIGIIFRGSRRVPCLHRKRCATRHELQRTAILGRQQNVPAVIQIIGRVIVDERIAIRNGKLFHNIAIVIRTRAFSLFGKRIKPEAVCCVIGVVSRTCIAELYGTVHIEHNGGKVACIESCRISRGGHDARIRNGIHGGLRLVVAHVIEQSVIQHHIHAVHGPAERIILNCITDLVQYKHREIGTVEIRPCKSIAARKERRIVCISVAGNIPKGSGIDNLICPFAHGHDVVSIHFPVGPFQHAAGRIAVRNSYGCIVVAVQHDGHALSHTVRNQVIGTCLTAAIAEACSAIFKVEVQIARCRTDTDSQNICLFIGIEHIFRFRINTDQRLTGSSGIASDQRRPVQLQFAVVAHRDRNRSFRDAEVVGIGPCHKRKFERCSTAGRCERIHIPCIVLKYRDRFFAIRSAHNRLGRFRLFRANVGGIDEFTHIFRRDDYGERSRLILHSLRIDRIERRHDDIGIRCVIIKVVADRSRCGRRAGKEQEAEGERAVRSGECIDSEVFRIPQHAGDFRHRIIARNIPVAIRIDRLDLFCVSIHRSSRDRQRSVAIRRSAFALGHHERRSRQHFKSKIFRIVRVENKIMISVIVTRKPRIVGIISTIAGNDIAGGVDIDRKFRGYDQRCIALCRPIGDRVDRLSFVPCIWRRDKYIVDVQPRRGIKSDDH